MKLDQLKAVRWKQGAAQFVLIVVGVMVALFADALRQDRSERRREAEYVTDLLADMETTLRMLDRAIAGDSIHIARVRSMLVYLQNTDDAPEDSIRKWRQVGWASFVPVTGTLRALFATGDLRLLRSGDLRRSVTAYLTDLEHVERQEPLATVDLAAASHLVREREEVHTRWTGHWSDSTNGSYTLNGKGMRADPTLRAAYTTAYVRNRYHLQRLLDFRVSVLGLRKVLVKERSGGH